ncbi:MAG: BatD family protein [Prolixibacteraceae bacterium]|nr:BatD family protein [Prolixibacteraceae bacterium]
MVKKLLVILLLFIGIRTFAEDTKFTMKAPGIVSAGDQFSLTLMLNAKGEDLRMPKIENFDILMGPSVSQSRSFQSVNGKMTQSISYTYTYILRANKVGTYSISPAAIKSKRKIYESNSISIEVIQGRKPATNSSNNQQGTTASTSKDNLFIQFETDKKSVFKGEMINTTFKLYSRVNLSIVDQTLPSLEGFWTQDIDIPSADQTRTQEAVDGVIYNVYTLQKKVLIPQQTGTLTIEPAEMVFNIQQRVRSQNVFDDFFGSVQNIKTEVKSKPIPITVKELPSTPQGFKGAVGKFSVTSSIDKASITANEAITLKVRVDGNGNLKHINPFDFNFPPDFEVYDAKTSYNFKASESGIIGSTTFEQIFIPRFAGDYTIPAQKFVYFEPRSKTYKTVYTKQFDIHVERGADDQNTTVVSSLSKENLKFIGEDIRYIKQDDLNLSKMNNTFFGSTLFYASFAGSLLAFILLILFQKKRLRENSNLALMRNKKASKMARKHLKAAAVCVKNNNKDEFFDALLKAFWGYLSDKLTLPFSELSRDNARTTLAQYSVDETTIEEFISVVDTCEMAKFAPTAVSDSIDELYKKGSKLIARFEKQIRKKAQ